VGLGNSSGVFVLVFSRLFGVVMSKVPDDFNLLDQPLEFFIALDIEATLEIDRQIVKELRNILKSEKDNGKNGLELSDRKAD